MLDIPEELIVQKNLLSYGPVIELLEIEMTELTTTLYLTSNNEDVVWGGHTWTKFPFRAGDQQDTSEGELSSFDIQVSNVLGIIEGYLDRTENDLSGDKVTYRLVHADYLDKAAFITSVWEILGVKCDSEWVTFSLGGPNIFSKRFPLNIYKYNLCRWRKFKGTECAYTGVGSSCDRTFSQCIT